MKIEILDVIQNITHPEKDVWAFENNFKVIFGENGRESTRKTNYHHVTFLLEKKQLTKFTRFHDARYSQEEQNEVNSLLKKEIAEKEKMQLQYKQVIEELEMLVYEEGIKINCDQQSKNEKSIWYTYTAKNKGKTTSGRVETAVRGGEWKIVKIFGTREDIDITSLLINAPFMESVWKCIRLELLFE